MTKFFSIPAEARQLPFWRLVLTGAVSSLLLTFGGLGGILHAPKSQLRLRFGPPSDALATSWGVRGEALGQG